MCNGFTTDGICMNTVCAVSLASHLRAVADALRPLRIHQRSATEQLRGEHYKSEVLQIGNTLLVVKAGNIYRDTTKMLYVDR